MKSIVKVEAALKNINCTNVLVSRLGAAFCGILCLIICNAYANETPEYIINSGDVLSVHVWGEKDLSLPEVLVRPDGRISIPILGSVIAGGKTINQTQETIKKKLKNILLDEPVVTVTAKSLSGNTVYVLGKVARPGAFPLKSKTDVTQALAVAGGLTTFAAENEILILRRDESGEQKALNFRYGKIANGKSLSENIILQSGDVVLVP